jgi:subtilase family serine protease
MMLFLSFIRNLLITCWFCRRWRPAGQWRGLRWLTTAAVLLAAWAGSATAQAGRGSLWGLQPVQQADRVAANPDLNALQSLKQRLPEWDQVRNQSSGSVDLSQVLHLEVVLSRDSAAEAAFQRLRVEQQSSGSRSYHQWVTPQQIGELFGPTMHDRAAVISWLTSQGLTVDSMDPNGLIIRVSGSAALVGNAFHTSFGSFDVAGERRFAALSQPLIPVALSAVIRSVHGLVEVRYAPQSSFKVETIPGVAGPLQTNIQSGVQTDLGGGVHGILPQDFATIYDLASVYSSGDKGASIGSSSSAQAQHIAIVGKSRIVADDIANFEAIAGLPSVQPNVVLAGSDPGVATGTQADLAGEATLDVERVIGTAPAAQPDLVISANSSNEDGVDIAIAYNINTLHDPVMSISFGACESESGSAEVDYLKTEFETAASEGISMFVSADDSGVAGCDKPFQAPPASQVRSINALCSSDAVTCVGGTEFNDLLNPSLYWSAANSNDGYESALSYIPEGAWNEPTTANTQGQTMYRVAEGGGGASVYVSKPLWQTGTGVPNDGFRDVPDIAFTAAEHDGYLGCYAAAGASCKTTNKGTTISIFYGTSAVAPGMAGIAALLNTKMGAAQGNLNPMLYGLAASNQDVFHAITPASSGVIGCISTEPSMCNNSTPGVSSLSGGLAGYSVGAGYNQATGLGSVDVAKLLSAAATGDVTGGSFTLAAASAVQSAAPQTQSATATWTLTVTALQSFAGTVSLTCAVAPVTSQPPLCSVSPANVSLSESGTATATVSAVAQGAGGGCLAQSAQQRKLKAGGEQSELLAGLLFLCLPIRGRWARARRSLPHWQLVCLLAIGLGAVSGCGGTSGSSLCSNSSTTGATAGTYTITVTGTSGNLTVSAPLTFIAN